jgi:hypothetical protein
MKHLKFLALLIAPMLIVSACKKSTVKPATTSYSMSFKINGTLVKTDSQESILNDAADVLNIDGTYNNNTTHLGISVVHPGVGTFDGINNQAQIQIADSKTSYGDNNGTVTITAYSPYSLRSVSGTFQFSFYSPDNELINITDGQFTTEVYY